jgi:hypothetical protein
MTESIDRKMETVRQRLRSIPDHGKEKIVNGALKPIRAPDGLREAKRLVCPGCTVALQSSKGAPTGPVVESLPRSALCRA